MALNATQRKALEKKALAEDSKSEGMRMLFDKDYTVAEVRSIFGVRYSFAYGVYTRNGGTGGTTPRATKPRAAKKTTAKAPAPARRTAAKKTARRAKATA